MWQPASARRYLAAPDDMSQQRAARRVLELPRILPSPIPQRTAAQRTRHQIRQVPTADDGFPSPRPAREMARKGRQVDRPGNAVISAPARSALVPSGPRSLGEHLELDNETREEVQA